MPSRWSTRILINGQHSPNLIEQFVLRNSKIYQLACNHWTVIDIVQKMSFSFTYSAKKLDQYQACLEQADPNTKECMGRRSKLQNLCETRWAARSYALFTFKTSFPVVIEALSYLSEDDAECRAYGTSIYRFDFIIALVVCEYVPSYKS